MANLRDLRQRITSVGNIQKITGAMEMVATTKLRRFQDRATAAKPYSQDIDELVRRLAGAVASDPEAAGDSAVLFTVPNSSAPRAVFFIGSDRGLCGAYNSNVQRFLDEKIAETNGGQKFYVMGRKAISHCERAGYDVTAYLEDHVLEKATFSDAAAISAMLVQAVRKGELSGVDLCFTRFVSMMRYEPVLEPFLPIAAPQGSVSDDAILEPGAPALLGRLIPKYLETAINHAMLESITSEYAARRFAMNNATEAAGEMKSEINRAYNRARQAKITSEILEIVSGAEAL
ncbi:MAG: ATP synthase F1 subunit gamma [Planctomycetes bacterium]|nr:ATP synthase F1 subunit gamma [Planctomycetota bacterium]